MADGKFGTLSGAGPARGPKRVTRTGLALVHENEIVYPAAGSAAEAIQALDDARTTVQVFFPVQVEIRDVSQLGAGDADDGHAGEQETLATVERALRLE